MQNNPLAGPNALSALQNSLEKDLRPGSYAIPPATGGDQISVRLDKSLLAHLDAIGELSEWSRVEVLTALVERGLFDLYDSLDDEIGKQIMEKHVNYCFFNALSSMAKALIERLKLSLTNEPGIQIHYTYTKGGDLRVRCLDGGKRAQNVVAISQQSKGQCLVCEAYADPQTCLELGATEATIFQHGPLNSIAKFDVSSTGDALIRVVHRSLTDFRNAQTNDRP